jgi:hypothetical protein
MGVNVKKRTGHGKKFKDMTFDERVVIKEKRSGPIDPDVARMYDLLRRSNEKKRIDRKKAVIAIMQMRGVEL